MDFTPPIAITPAINHLCVEIGTLVGSLESRVPPRDARLVRRIHEGQIDSLVQSQEPEGLLGDEGARQALRGAIMQAYQRFEAYDPASLSDLMRLNTLLADALGVWDVWRTEDDVRTAAGIPCVPAANVQGLTERLLEWYDRTELHPLVASCVFRFECSVIRPFACASDLTRRLWHYRMLIRWNPVFCWVDVEAALRERRPLLLAAVKESRRRINDAPYVALMLEVIREALGRLDAELGQAPERGANVEQVLLYFADRPTATISDAAASLGIAPRTCARYVAELQREGRLRRVGSRKKGLWKVIG